MFCSNYKVIVLFICSMEHTKDGDCSKALAAKGIKGTIDAKDKVKIKYTYSVTFKVRYYCDNT